MQKFQELYDAVLKGDAKTARQMTEQALRDRVEPLCLVNDVMAPAMDEVGRKYECSEYFVPELLLASRAMKAALELVRPLLVAGGAQPVGRIVIGTVKGDLHDIGKNLVAALLEGGGFEVIDVGTNVAAEKFVTTAQAKGAQIIAMSALLTTTMVAMKATMEALRSAGVREQFKVLVGGAPITQTFADEIGADAYGESAPAAVTLARKLIAAGSGP